MTQTRKRIQVRLDLTVAVLFALLTFATASISISYVPISAVSSIEMAMIPAVFAALIGGYKVGVPTAIIWSLIAHYNIDSSVSLYPVSLLIIKRVLFLASLYYAYTLVKNIYKFSPFNVYRAIFIGITIKNLISGVNLAYLVFASGMSIVGVKHWLNNFFAEYLLELGLVSLAMFLIVKQLREVHILNGVRAKSDKKTKENKKK